MTFGFELFIYWVSNLTLLCIGSLQVYKYVLSLLDHKDKHAAVCRLDHVTLMSLHYDLQSSIEIL